MELSLKIVKSFEGKYTVVLSIDETIIVKTLSVVGQELALKRFGQLLISNNQEIMDCIRSHRS